MELKRGTSTPTPQGHFQGPKVRWERASVHPSRISPRPIEREGGHHMTIGPAVRDASVSCENLVNLRPIRRRVSDPDLWLEMLTIMPNVEYNTRYPSARPSIASLLSSWPHLSPCTVTTRLCLLHEKVRKKKKKRNVHENNMTQHPVVNMHKGHL
jgi:hypothetical protein